MSGLDKNRFRNKTISFRVSPEEAQKLEARIKVCGMLKGEYFIQSLLYNRISIVVGKYQSDRLSLELRRLREYIQELESECYNEEIAAILMDCKALLVELESVTKGNDNTNDLKMSDLVVEK